MLSERLLVLTLCLRPVAQAAVPGMQMQAQLLLVLLPKTLLKGMLWYSASWTCGHHERLNRETFPTLHNTPLAVPHRSALRQDKRAEALKECVKMITAQGGGCCTVFPYEAAIWLLEEQEELVGTNKRPINRCCACPHVPHHWLGCICRVRYCPLLSAALCQACVRLGRSHKCHLGRGMSRQPLGPPNETLPFPESNVSNLLAHIVGNVHKHVPL